MNIAFLHSHAPYASMLIRAFPEHRFYVNEWAGFLRDLPSNAQFVSGPRIMGEFDCVIMDRRDRVDVSKMMTRRNVFIIHCEQNHDDNSTSLMNYAFDSMFDFVVSVSEWKASTLKHFADDPRLRVIRFSSDFPKRMTEPVSGRVGVVGNGLSHEKVSFIQEVSDGYPDFVTIGHGNSDSCGTIIHPNNFTEYVQALHSLDVFVNVVDGNSFGMTPMEAMASGIPTIHGESTDCLSLREHSKNCLVTKGRIHQSVQQVREMIHELVSDREKNKRIGNAGKVAVADYFSPSVFREKWSEVLES